MFIVPDTQCTCVCFQVHIQYAYGSRQVVVVVGCVRA